LIDTLNPYINVFNSILQTINVVFKNFGILINSIISNQAIDFIKLVGNRLGTEFTHRNFSFMFMYSNTLEGTANEWRLTIWVFTLENIL